MGEGLRGRVSREWTVACMMMAMLSKLFSGLQKRQLLEAAAYKFWLVCAFDFPAVEGNTISEYSLSEGTEGKKRS